jgi:hypothetical protein
MKLPGLIANTGSKINESKSRLTDLQSITTNIMAKKDELERSIHSDIFTYDSSYILEMLEISSHTKDYINKMIASVCIYNVRNILDEKFVVSYYVNDDEYEFTVTTGNRRFNPVVVIRKNGVITDLYNMKIEFIALDFEKIKKEKFLENYVNLMIKTDKNHKFGMIILAHFYLIEYKQHKTDGIDVPSIIKNTKRLTEIFRYDLSSYISDNFQPTL